MYKVGRKIKWMYLQATHRQRGTLYKVLLSNEDYDYINGTEGNGQAAGYRYSDTEDMNNNRSEDFKNEYFTIEINPKQGKDEDNSMVVKGFEQIASSFKYN